MGRSFTLGSSLELEVAGILEDPPSNSHFDFTMLVSFPSFNSDFTGGFRHDDWGVTMSGYCYVRLPGAYDLFVVEDRITSLIKKHKEEDEASREQFYLQPLHDVHFDSKYVRAGFKTVDEAYLIVITSIGLFILVIACINYVNLSTALAVRKAKEVGIRKTLGAGRKQLILQFMGETSLTVLLAGILSLGLVEWLLPFYNEFFEKEVALHLLDDTGHMMLLPAILIMVTVVSGFYPALVLTRYEPVRVLKSRVTGPSGSSVSLRRGLVIFQFVITQILIIGIIVISDQLSYFHSKPLGFEKDAIVTAHLFNRDSSTMVRLKEQLLLHKNIQKVSFGLGVPISDNNIGTSFRMSSDDSSIKNTIILKTADKDYLETFGLKMIAGRWMNENDNLTTERGIIVNETATRLMGFTDPAEAIEQRVELDIEVGASIIGVVEDFHMQALHEKIKPMAILNEPALFYEAGIRISSHNIPETIAFIEELWSQTYPEHIFEYSFLDEHIAKLYDEEERALILMHLFAGISVVIGCLGLFGLISFVVFQKNKEVGIRKVLGATLAQLVYFLSREFLVLTVVAFLIASPVAWFLMDGWLTDFAYRINLTPVYFLMALTATVVIVMITIGYRSVKAAFVNPVEVLRDE